MFHILPPHVLQQIYFHMGPDRYKLEKVLQWKDAPRYKLDKQHFPTIRWPRRGPIYSFNPYAKYLVEWIYCYKWEIDSVVTNLIPFLFDISATLIFLKFNPNTIQRVLFLLAMIVANFVILQTICTRYRGGPCFKYLTYFAPYTIGPHCSAIIRSEFYFQ